jgi:hypothetical protein
MLLFAPVEGLGSHFGSIRSGREQRDHHYYYGPDYDARRIQQDKIEAEEEARREPVREKRRDEIEKRRNAELEAYLEAQEAIRSSSQAAFNAPRGFFFRKPGSSTTRLPAGAMEMDLNGRNYSYFSGVFYLDTGVKHVVVTAPTGVVVESLPEGHGTTRYGETTYYYYFGTFFARKGEGFEVVHPRPGVVVGYLPDGYNEVRETEEGSVIYEYGGVYFQPVFLDGILSYMVVRE